MKYIVSKYNQKILGTIRSQKLIVNIDSLSSLEMVYRDVIRNNQVIAIVVNLPYTSISTIDYKTEWEQIPLVIKAYNIGNYNEFFSKIEFIRQLNIRVYLSNTSDTVCTDLKVLSSLGVDCGILIEDNHIMEDDKLLDLASYCYMSPAAHATIEPFEYILRHLSDENITNFNAVYFRDPLLYTEVNTVEDATMFESITSEDDFREKMDCYYKHFMDLDECSKCAAFKICNHQMKNKLEDCKKTMNEIYEFAECRNELNNNTAKQKTICQL